MEKIALQHDMCRNNTSLCLLSEYRIFEYIDNLQEVRVGLYGYIKKYKCIINQMYSCCTTQGEVYFLLLFFSHIS